MPKYTPGPWAYRPAEHDDWGIVRAPVIEQGQWTGGIICQARDPEVLDQITLAKHREAKTDPWEANARLIAAAPEMAEALRSAVDALEGKTPDLDQQICCNGHQCGCRGSTNRCLLVHGARALLAKIDGDEA